MSKEPEAELLSDLFSCGLIHWTTLNNKMIRCHQEIQKLLGSPGRKADFRALERVLCWSADSYGRLPLIN